MFIVFSCEYTSTNNKAHLSPRSENSELAHTGQLGNLTMNPPILGNLHDLLR